MGHHSDWAIVTKHLKRSAGTRSTTASMGDRTTRRVSSSGLGHGLATVDDELCVDSLAAGRGLSDLPGRLSESEGRARWAVVSPCPG
jgi:hypothetical protein